MTGIVEGYKPGEQKPEFVGFLFPSGKVMLEGPLTVAFEAFDSVAEMVDAVKKEYGTDFKLLVHEHTLTRSVRTLKLIADVERLQPSDSC